MNTVILLVCMSIPIKFYDKEYAEHVYRKGDCESREVMTEEQADKLIDDWRHNGTSTR